MRDANPYASGAVAAGNATTPARRTVDRIARRCWSLMLGIIGLALVAQLWPVGGVRLAVALALYLLVAGVSLFGFKLARERSPAAAPWQIIALTGALAALSWWAPDDSGVWLLFPLIAVISVIFFRPATVRLHGILLMAALLLSRFAGGGLADMQDELVRAAFIPILAYLMEQARRRESQLMAEIDAWSADADAFTTISWSLTTLTPSADITAMLARACPPHVSLGWLRLDPASRRLVPEAAVGPDAATILRWQYSLRPESTSMVALCLRERRPLAASIAAGDADMLLAGALPETALPLRSAAVLPVMRQDAAPFGVLLALSSQAEAVGRTHQLGILPAVANQFAVALDNARLYAEAQERADHDAMTGLYHHRAIHKRLNEEVVRANRSAAPFAVLMIDLDRFRLYNETYGHQVGDRVIVQAANAIRRGLRSSDILSRYGGDEFLAILPDTDPAEARHLAQSLLESIAAEEFRPQENAERMPLTLSIGVALYPNDGGTAMDLAARAEAAMNEAHHSGGNRCEMAQPSETETANGRAIDLRGFGILESLVTAVDHKDRYTKEHSEEVATYAQLLAEELGFSSQRCALLFDAGLLHDVGKVGVPDAVLRKPGRLTPEEFAAMKQHVVLSEALLRCLLPADTDPDVLDAVRFHHERWDGRGYPYGLAGEDVPLIGRIMIVADATSAMHMDRPYRRGLAPAQIVSELRRGAGSQFDPALVDPFIKVFLRFHNLTEADLAAPPPSHSSVA
jgi:diguanylate cyclase (GGDEF)-like protein